MENQLKTMTISELRNFAMKKKIVIPSNAKKVDIIMAIIRNKFQKMKVVELKEYAVQNNISLSTSKKSEIIDRIIEEKRACFIDENGEKKTVNKEKSLVTEPGRTILKKKMWFGYQYELGVYTICSKCGEEVYASCKTNSDAENARSHPEFVKLFAKCPNCQKKMGLINGRYIERYTADKYPKVFKELRMMIEENKRIDMREKNVELLNSSTKNHSIENATTQVVLNSVEYLKKYLSYLIHMETEIYLINERIIELKLRELRNEQSIVRANLLINKELEEEHKEVKEHILLEISELENRLINPYDYINESVLEINVEYDEPNKPQVPKITKPIEPQKPNLKKPGLFNKKKILQENQVILEKYNREKEVYEIMLQEYDSKHEQYKKELLAYEKTFNEYQKQYKSQKWIAIENEGERIVEDAKIRIEHKKVELDEIVQRYSESLEEKIKYLPQMKIRELLSNEQNILGKELKKIIKARDELYAYNVIYKKYRNYIALTAFYEYLDSGRCDTLEGSTGAYNVFEAEIRSNEIIVQLNTIVDSLEVIKANQFLLYREMKKVNSNLQKMNSSLLDAIDCLSKIECTTSKILDMSIITAQASIDTAYNTAATAHFSAITAHYSKVNAELTNALGFMLAMK